MRTIGFTELKDKRIINNKYINNEPECDSICVEIIEREKVISYLSNSTVVFSITLALYDGETYIGPYMIFSDGDWIWPSHFPYYLSKSGFINGDFLNNIRIQNYQPRLLDDSKIKEAVTFVELKLKS